MNQSDGRLPFSEACNNKASDLQQPSVIVQVRMVAGVAQRLRHNLALQVNAECAAADSKGLLHQLHAQESVTVEDRGAVEASLAPQIIDHGQLRFSVVIVKRISNCNTCLTEQSCRSNTRNLQGSMAV